MNIGKWLVIGGVGLAIVGALVWMGVPLGKLPGDIHVKGERTQIYIPITTSIVLSVVVSLILWLLRAKR